VGQQSTICFFFSRLSLSCCCCRRREGGREGGRVLVSVARAGDDDVLSFVELEDLGGTAVYQLLILL